MSANTEHGAEDLVLEYWHPSTLEERVTWAIESLDLTPERLYRSNQGRWVLQLPTEMPRTPKMWALVCDLETGAREDLVRLALTLIVEEALRVPSCKASASLSIFEQAIHAINSHTYHRSGDGDRHHTALMAALLVLISRHISPPETIVPLSEHGKHCNMNCA